MGIITSFLARRRNVSGGSSSVVIQPSQQPWSVVQGLELDDYKANFADIRPIAEKFSAVLPYAVDSQGNRLQAQPKVIQKLYSPNSDMNFYDFADYLISSLLSQPRVIVRVIFQQYQDQDGRPVRRHLSSDIKGFIFLPPNSRQNFGNGRVQYQYTDADGIMQTAYPDEVMEFYYSMSTDGFGVGVSPAQATKKWATIADYIAAYQAGFFQNGAKPDGMFIITANSKEQYDSAREEMEAIHKRGHRGHFQYQYAYRPTDEQGNPLKTSSVEWVSFGSTNKDLTLGELIDKTQEKQDSAFGVPAIARGNDATATYNNAQVSDRNLALKIDYLLRRVWSRFQHEVARICDDELDWSISFDFEVPALADADKIDAETNSVNIANLISLIDHGATVEQACKALGLGQNWQELTLTKTEVPSLPLEHQHDPLDLEHPHVDMNRRYAGDKLTPRQKLVRLVVAENKRIVREVKASRNAYQPTGDEIDEFARQMQAILQPLAIKAQGTMIKAIAKQFKLEVPEHVPTAIEDPNWWKRLAAVAKSHDEYVADWVEQLLIQAEAEGLTAKQTSDLLQQVVSPEKADVLARNEIVNSERFGQLQSVQVLADANGLKAYKVWKCHEDDRTCPFCLKMNGTKVPIADAFAKLGDVIEADGKQYAIDWQPLDVPDAHCNCRCTFYPEFEA